MIPPVIKTARLILRPLKPGDEKAHYKHINDWEVARYLGPGFPWPYPENGSAHYLSRNSGADAESLHWAITWPDKYNDELLGVIELRPNEEEGQRGFWLGRAFHNNGIMTEAICATNDHWFYTLDRPTLNLKNAEDNRASSRLKEKTGARLLRVQDGRFLDPALTREEVWELSETDWRRFKNENTLLPAKFV